MNKKIGGKKMLELLKLLKAAKESELEVITQLYEKELEKNDEKPEIRKPINKGKVKPGVDKNQADETDEDFDSVTGYDSMTAKDLYELCCQRGISGKAAKNRKKENLIRILKENDAENSAAEVDGDGDDWEDEPEMDYTAMTPKELYKECKSRGIEAKTGKKAEVYIKLLEKYDTEHEDEDQDEECGDDWEI